MFELLFHYPLTVYRKGDFLFASGWPVWLLVLLVLAAGAALFWNMRQSPGRLTNRQKLVIWGLQAAMAATALFAFWQPGLSVQSLSSQQNVVSVLLDASRSMALGDGGEQSRLQKAVTALQNGVIEGLEKRFRVRLYTFSSEADRLQSLEELPPPGPSSRIGDSVAGVLRESAASPLGAVIVLSDGSDNSGSFSRELMSEIRKRNVPIHTVGLGATEIDGDLELADVVAPATALPKSRVSAQMTIRHPGVAQPGRISVKDGDTVLASKEVALRRGENVQVEMVDFSAGEPGLRDLSFTVDPLPGEEITGNNTLSRVMDVRADASACSTWKASRAGR
ncbi:MAG: vWA domain-containing protein [Bryobacterales bacterium]